MPKLTMRQTEYVLSKMDRMAGRIQDTIPVDHEMLFRMCWTDEEYELAQRAHKITHANAFEARVTVGLPTAFGVRVPENLPWPNDDRTVDISLAAYFREVGPLPDFERGMREDAPEDVQVYYNQKLLQLVEGCIVEASWKWWIRMVGGREHTIETLRYMFPGMVYILREAGLHEIASKVETIKSVPKLPPLSHFLRERLRHLNTWFATQMLLGTFEGNTPKPSTQALLMMRGNVWETDAEGRTYVVME